jgi:hypothetical protein
MPGKGARRGADMRRAAAALLLVAVAAAGLRAGGAFSSAGSREILGLSGQAMYWILAVAEAILALAGIVLLVLRMIWARQSGKPLQRQRRSMWWLLLLPLLVFGLARILRRIRRHAPAAAAATVHGASAKAGAAGHLRVGDPWPLLALFAVVAVGAAALAVYRRRRPVLPPPEPDLEPAAEPLVAALAAGARVLHEDPDPRTAIIGCYAAMERSLADAGSPPRMADTPAEVLGRATASGLVRSAPATTLTGLFRQARYSSHPMTEADRTAAIGTLAQVRTDLGSGALAQADLGDP